ncbi:hypothetical protein B0T13DRAFT_445061 [Neurospora crassa]|nr:hypothetical protein B0T13DRAFT_445061 [Neurospora crassa]
MIACLETLYELVYAVLFIGIVIFDALRNPERLPGESEVSAVERGRGGAYRGGGEHEGDVERSIGPGKQAYDLDEAGYQRGNPSPGISSGQDRCRTFSQTTYTDFRHSWRSMGGAVREDDVRASTGVDDLVKARSLEMECLSLWLPLPRYWELTSVMDLDSNALPSECRAWAEK